MPQNRTPPRQSAYWKLIALVVFFLALFLAWRYTPLSELATAEQMMKWARAMGNAPWAPAAVILIYTPAAFAMFPRPLITLFAVLAFGPWRGLAVSLIGILGSAIAVYSLGRALPERSVRRIAGKRLERTTQAVRRRGLMSAFAVSVAPVAPFPVIGLVAGAVRIRLWHYLVGTMLGMLPGTLATTVFARQIEAALEDPERINYWVVALVVAILVALVVGARRWLLNVQEEGADRPVSPPA